MRQFQQFIDSTAFYIDNTAQSKTAVLLKISQIMHRQNPSLAVESLFDAYWARESLGSTAIGHGVLVPHIRHDKVSSISGCFLQLQHPVDFGAVDKQPIDLVLGLLVPQSQVSQHLNTLAFITEQFNLPSLRKACRQAKTPQELAACFYEEDLMVI